MQFEEWGGRGPDGRITDKRGPLRLVPDNVVVYPIKTQGCTGCWVRDERSTFDCWNMPTCGFITWREGTPEVIAQYAAHLLTD